MLDAFQTVTKVTVLAVQNFRHNFPNTSTYDYLGLIYIDLLKDL